MTASSPTADSFAAESAGQPPFGRRQQQQRQQQRQQPRLSLVAAAPTLPPADTDGSDGLTIQAVEELAAAAAAVEADAAAEAAAEADAAAEAAAEAKASGIAKLLALGLTEAEANALVK